MNRRNFFKVVTGFVAGIFAGFVWAKQKPLTLDMLIKAKEELESEPKCSCYDMSSPFVLYNGVWFFADQDIIKYCPKDKLHWDNWESIRILFPLERYDYFDFWLLDEGKLFWCGEHDSRFEIIEDYEGRIGIKAIMV